MTLQTTQVDITSRSGTAIAGLPVWPVAAFAHEAVIAATMPEAMVAYVQAGRSDLRGAVAPMRERDACDLSRVWTAQSNAMPSRLADNGVLSGLPRWVGSGSIASRVGLTADIGAALTDYTIACLARITTGAVNNCFVNIGSTATERIMLYTSTADRIAVQHGSSDQKVADVSVTLGAWLPIVASYRHSDKAMRVYAGSTTPLISATMTASPPASALASLMITPDTNVELAGELVFAAIWNEPVHLDSVALAGLVGAMNGLAAL
jgi:hypothetical protein